MIPSQTLAGCSKGDVHAEVAWCWWFYHPEWEVLDTALQVIAHLTKPIREVDWFVWHWNTKHKNLVFCIGLTTKETSITCCLSGWGLMGRVRMCLGNHFRKCSHYRTNVNWNKVWATHKRNPNVNMTLKANESNLTHRKVKVHFQRRCGFWCLECLLTQLHKLKKTMMINPCVCCPTFDWPERSCDHCGPLCVNVAVCVTNQIICWKQQKCTQSTIFTHQHELDMCKPTWHEVTQNLHGQVECFGSCACQFKIEDIGRSEESQALLVL